MKKHLVFIAICALVLVSSCTTHFFTEPQPYDVKSEKEMPKTIMGTWEKLNERETHIIDKTTWVSIKTDTLGNQTTKVEYNISDSLVIKKADKLYFINTSANNKYWVVYLGYKEGDNFYIKGLGDDDTLTLKTSLGLVPDSTTDTKELYYNQSLTKKQIKKLFKDGGFADTLMIFDLKNRTLDNL